MNEKVFSLVLWVLLIGFTIAFCILVLPPFFQQADILAAFAAGFVNPYAAGYSTDVVFCWFILCFWVSYEAKTLSIRNGWVCLLLGIVPGVAVGFALYLIIRMRHMNRIGKDL
ncbi:MAG: DUF2834 domain-containing protein [Spirochaetota bacterium]